MYISDICFSVGRNEWEKGKEGEIDGPMSEKEGGREGWMEEGKGVAFVPRPLKRALHCQKLCVNPTPFRVSVRLFIYNTPRVLTAVSFDTLKGVVQECNGNTLDSVV